MEEPPVVDHFTMETREASLLWMSMAKLFYQKLLALEKGSGFGPVSEIGLAFILMLPRKWHWLGWLHFWWFSLDLLGGVDLLSNSRWRWMTSCMTHCDTLNFDPIMFGNPFAHSWGGQWCIGYALQHGMADPNFPNAKENSQPTLTRQYNGFKMFQVFLTCNYQDMAKMFQVFLTVSRVSRCFKSP